MLLLSLSLINACATRREIVDFKKDSFYLRSQVDSLRVGQRSLNLAIRKLQAQTEQNAESTAKFRADVQTQLNQLTAQTQLLNDRLEDTGRRISNLPAKLYSSVSPSPAAATNNGTSLADTSRDERLRQLPGSLRLCESAYQDFIKGHYALAREGFMQYLRLLPEGEMANYAQYWIGESYYAQQQFEQAIQTFQTVIDKYPNSDKVPAAMLKLAYSKLALGQKTAGKESLETLIRRFPQTNEAKLARSRLQELK